MWVAKGILLGLGMFLIGTFFFLSAAVRPRGSNAAIGLSVFTAMTYYNPLWWTALVASVVLGCCIVGSWPVPVKP